MKTHFHRPSLWQLACVFGLALTLAFTPALLRSAELPPVPARDGVGFFIHDYAGLLDKVATERIQQAQKQAFEEHDTPIIVVTIASMSRYGHSGNIESLATEWFNAWRIGTEDRPDGANRGVLVLVSVGDRKARIELGGDWGKDWDAYCQRVMDREMVPFFKQQDYGRGIANGVESLLLMAERGPQGTAPALQVREPSGDETNDGGGGLNNGIGSCCAWPLLMLLALLSTLFRGGFGSHGGGYSGGSGYSGGGFSGGRSGGGGATGSW